MTIIWFCISLLTAAWVLFDAQERGKGFIVAALWSLGTQLLPIIFLPLWLYARPERCGKVVVVERPLRCAHCGK